MNHENGTTNINELIKKMDEKLEEIKLESSNDNSENGNDVQDILNYIHEHPQNLQDFLETIKEKSNNNQ